MTKEQEKYIRAKFDLQQKVFSIAEYGGIDVEEIPLFMGEVADDIEKEIERQKD